MPWMTIPIATAIAGISGGAATAYGAHKASSANKTAAQLQTDAANRAAELEAKSAAEALAFSKQQEEERKREWEATQAKNFELWQQRRSDLAPYRNLGAGAVSQFTQPIYPR